MDWRQVRSDLRFVWPIAITCLVLAFNATRHHDTYVPKVPDAYLAPAVTTVPVTSTTIAPVPSSVVAKPEQGPWDRLADCESGDHDLLPDGRWRVHPGTARWHISDGLHQGGLQFAVRTWDAYALDGFPADAHLATREQQILVAKRVRDGVPGSRDPYLNAQGWAAWPWCSRQIGLR